MTSDTTQFRWWQLLHNIPIRWQVASHAACLLVGAGVGAGIVCWYSTDDNARVELRAMFAILRLGDSTAEIDRKFGVLATNNLRCSQSPFCEGRHISTPISFGARNWHLWILTRNDIIVAFGIRCEDNLKIKPAAAPDDIVLEDMESKWNSIFGPR